MSESTHILLPSEHIRAVHPSPILNPPEIIQGEHLRLPHHMALQCHVVEEDLPIPTSSEVLVEEVELVAQGPGVSHLGDGFVEVVVDVLYTIPGV